MTAGSSPPAHASTGTSAARDRLNACLRQPEGVFPARWSASCTAADGGGEADLNELLPLCVVWTDWSPDVARELVLSALAAQHPDGSFPRRIRSDGYVTAAHPPWPLLAQAADTAAGEIPPPDFVADVLPALERYLDWALHRYVPPDGVPRWPRPDEAWLPEVWSADLRPVDLTAMLTAELEAGAALAERCHAGGVFAARFGAALAALRRTLEQFHFDPATGLYLDRDAGGRPASRRTVSVFTPLWTRGLSEARRRRIERELEVWPAPEDGGLPLWEPWPDDPAPPPSSALHQAVLLAGLRCAGSATVAGLGPAQPMASAEAMAAALLVRPPIRRASIFSSRPWARPLALSAAALGLVALAGTGWYMVRRPSLPGATGEVLLNMAQQRHRAGQPDEAIRIYRRFLALSGSTSGTVRVLLGNAFYRAGRYREAEAEYRAAMAEEVSSLHALYNLGLALHHQGRNAEAADAFEKFAATYRVDYPELASRARVALNIIRGQPIEFNDIP